MAGTGRGLRDQGGVMSPRVSLAELARRIDNLAQIGVVSHADYKAGKLRVKIGAGKDSITTQWLPWSTERAGNNRTYNAPEVGEQVMVIAPSGNLNNGVVHRTVPYKQNPHESDTPDIKKETYRTKPGELDAMMEFNRKTGVRRWHLKQKGMFRWEVGGGASVIMDEKHIQLRVGKTQIVLEDEKISLFVNGQESSLVMQPKDITAQVQSKGVLQITDQLIAATVNRISQLVIKDSDISLTLTNARVGLRITADAFKAMAGSTWVNLTKTLATIFGGSSGVDCGPSGITNTGPKWEGINGAHTPGTYSNTSYSNPPAPTPHKTVAATTPNKGTQPSMPA